MVLISLSLQVMSVSNVMTAELELELYNVASEISIASGVVKRMSYTMNPDTQSLHSPIRSGICTFLMYISMVCTIH